MITIPEVMARVLGDFLAAETRGRFRASNANLADFLPYISRLTLECIGNSDALYHNIEHSMLVTLVGHDILVGRSLNAADDAADYSNFILACLTHDIGYVRGVVQGDEETPMLPMSRSENPVAGRLLRRSDGALPCRPLQVIRHRALRRRRRPRRRPDCPGHRIYPLSLSTPKGQTRTT